MIFIDCLALLMILSKWGQSDFWPDPGDVVRFDASFPLIKKHRDWLNKVTLIKVKSHYGCFLKEMADERAEKGSLSEAVPINLIVPLPSDDLEAPNKQILRQTTRANLIQALKLSSCKESDSVVSKQ